MKGRGLPADRDTPHALIRLPYTFDEHVAGFIEDQVHQKNDAAGRALAEQLTAFWLSRNWTDAGTRHQGADDLISPDQLFDLAFQPAKLLTKSSTSREQRHHGDTEVKFSLDLIVDPGRKNIATGFANQQANWLL